MVPKFEPDLRKRILEADGLKPCEDSGFLEGS